MTTRHHARYQYVGTTVERGATAPPATAYGVTFFDTDLSVEYTWDGVAWMTGGGGVHNALPGLQGGAPGEYYHLTAAQHTAVGLMVTAGLDALTAAEVDQLENINAVTISNAQWGYLGAMNQGVATTDSPTFANVTVEETSTIVAGTIIAVRSDATANPGAASAASTYAFYGVAKNAPANNQNCTGTIALYRGTADWYGSGTLASLYGFWPSVTTRNTGTVTSGVGVFGYVTNVSTGTIVTGTGLRGQVDKGGGAVTYARGVMVDKVTGGQAIGVYIYGVAGTTASWGVFQQDLGIENYFASNIMIGTTSHGTNAAQCLVLSNTATAPADSANVVHLYAEDVAASTVLAVYQETVPIAIGTFTASHKWLVRINGVSYYIQLDAV